MMKHITDDIVAHVECMERILRTMVPVERGSTTSVVRYHTTTKAQIGKGLICVHCTTVYNEESNKEGSCHRKAPVYRSVDTPTPENRSGMIYPCCNRMCFPGEVCSTGTMHEQHEIEVEAT